MTDEQRQVFERAFAVLDAVDAIKAEPKLPLSYEQQAEADDAFIAELQRRRLEREPLVYKTVNPEPKAAELIDSDRQWVQQQLEALASVVGEETGKEDSKLYAEIKTLKAEVASLRADLETLRQHKADRDVADVVPLRGRA
jgi:anion-transporting  ArsA/GET3 family ATPase